MILDDAPFVRDGNVVRPVAATFHRFAAAVVAAGPFSRARYLIPVREAGQGIGRSDQPPVDEGRLQIVATAPFSGAAGYLARLPLLVARNRPVIRRAVRGAHLVWIKAPASNAVLAADAARNAGVPRFTYVAGRAGDVVAAQRRGGLDAVAAAVAANLYDRVTDRLVSSGPSIVLGYDIFTSLVELDEIVDLEPPSPAVPPRGAVRLVWAGRVVGEKGLDDLVEAVARLSAGGRDVRVDLLGDGPARSAIEDRARAAGVADRLAWHGEVTDRATYLSIIRAADLFVLPSRAEGVPKVLVDAMASGVPVIASRTGGIESVVGEGRGWLVRPADPSALAGTIERAIADPLGRSQRREAGLAFAQAHTIGAQASRLVEWMRAAFPALPWPAGEAGAS